MLLRPFDPWKSPSCTCPAKLSLNPYTGCPHGCLYCYASSYIPRFQESRPKADLEGRLRREVLRLKPGCLVTMSSSSDPYPPQERDLEITRGCLKILMGSESRVQVFTKSDLVCRDADLLSVIPSMVSITITATKDDLSRRLEPRAPMPERRLRAVSYLRKRGIPVSVRIDPVIPGINGSEIEDLVRLACEAGAQHITSSTYKARPDNWKRMISAFPEHAEGLANIFKGGSILAGSRYMPAEIRRSLMQRVERAAAKNGVTFGSCREGITAQKGVLCDGSHLIVGGDSKVNKTQKYIKFPNNTSKIH